ncbi:MAG: hypothetical protein CMC82_08980 [Flavobacteriaceae bacterium]|nr:hypothetical protein [Flavobacteriaceae bacterium]
MNIIGISFGYHDSASALIKGDKLVFADHEERYTGVKNDQSFPKQSLNECFKILGNEKVDAIIYYEDSIIKLDRIVKSNLKFNSFNPKLIVEAMIDWYKNEKFDPLEKIFFETKINKDKIHFVEHHRSHAASSFYLSPFESSTIITLDGVGEWETATISYGEKNKIKKLKSIRFPHSIGLFYSAFTSFLGFQVNEGEYKVMGMAAYGKPKYYDKVKKLISLNQNLQFEINQNYFDFEGVGEFPFNENFMEEFGIPRRPNVKSIEKNYFDIAASVQLVTEEFILEFAKNAANLTGSKNLCFSGGVALNSSANGRIIRETDLNLFVPPAAGDAGGAIGAALDFYYSKNQNNIKKILSSPFLGRVFSEDDICNALSKSYLKNFKKIDDTNNLLELVAKSLNEGKVVGWFVGASEIGPRALGARSILADPRGPGTQDLINEKIKFRETFRPFAPSVLAEEASKYFDIKNKLNFNSPENYMLSIAEVKKKYRVLLPAITHVNNTARVQTVFKEHNEIYYNLIEKFKSYSGIPILLNTSFNLKGDPIVGTPTDAINTFLSSGIDILILGNFFIEKET